MRSRAPAAARGKRRGSLTLCEVPRGTRGRVCSPQPLQDGESLLVFHRGVL